MEKCQNKNKQNKDHERTNDHDSPRKASLISYERIFYNYSSPIEYNEVIIKGCNGQGKKKVWEQSDRFDAPTGVDE